MRNFVEFLRKTPSSITASPWLFEDRLALVLGAILYPIWCAFVMSIDIPGNLNGFRDGYGIGLMSFLAFALTYLSRRVFIHHSLLATGVVSSIVIHLFAITYVNQSHPIFVTGCFIAVFATASMVNVPSHLYFFSSLVLALSLGVFTHEADSSIALVRIFGMVTALFIHVVSHRQRWQLLKKEQMARQTMEDQFKKVTIQSRLSALGEMAAGIAHEINNPLAMISLRAHVAKLALPENPDEAKKSLELIEITVQRMAQIIRGLKNFSRDPSHDPFVPVPLAQICQDVWVLSQVKVKHNNVKLVWPEVSSDLVLECRSTQLGQILMNLVGNAIDATQGISSPLIEMQIKTTSQFVVITMTDNGPGIKPENREKIFMPYFTTKDAEKGTGLGLSISRAIAEAHGGRLALKPTGSGACFVLTLPLKQAGKNQSPAAA